MDINYLYSIVELYLKKETLNKKCNLVITKLENDRIQFSFNMDTNDVNVTTFSIPVEEVFENDNFQKLIRTYKQNNIVIEEKYSDVNNNYYILLNNGRMVSFKKFTLVEFNNIRNIIYDIKMYKEDIKIKFEEEMENENKYYFKLQPTGFINFKILSIVTICFIVIFILSLWIFNIFIK